VESFDDLVASSGRRLLRLGLMLSGSLHTAEDLTQTVLARAYRRWDQVSAAERPEAYVRKMLVNEFLSWRRRMTSQEVPVAIVADVPGDEDPGTRQAQRDAMWRLLARLPKQQRAVLVLRYYEDLADDEIAAVLGCARSTVRTNAARALAGLRAAVRESDEEQKR
jgi:RNA polymerase sigma-70 factor (sigma-E family)